MGDTTLNLDGGTRPPYNLSIGCTLLGLEFKTVSKYIYQPQTYPNKNILLAYLPLKKKLAQKRKKLSDFLVCILVDTTMGSHNPTPSLRY